MFNIGPLELLVLLVSPISGCLAALYLGLALRHKREHHSSGS